LRPHGPKPRALPSAPHPDYTLIIYSSKSYVKDFRRCNKYGKKLIVGIRINNFVMMEARIVKLSLLMKIFIYKL
ncbi:hypothetical protein, partial [Clostridium beijerinckii]|uniref:hypothetical protein n=1 Tax=Clostridium beijerinckii TaxID=1520 RepID=UPI001A9A6D92